MHFKPKFPLMAKAQGESAADFGINLDPNNIDTDDDLDTSGLDRGDVVSDELLEEEPRAPRKSPKKKEAAKEDGDDGDDEEDADADADADAEADPAPLVEPVKKPGRAEKRITQLLEHTAALERQLNERNGNAAVTKQLTELETQAAQLDKEYLTALSEDADKASALMVQIRAVNRQIARVEASAEVETAITERMEQRDLMSTITDLTEKFPELMQGHDDFDQDLTNEVNAVFQGLIASSSSKSAAMRKAVRYVLGTVEREVAPTTEKVVDVEAIREKRRVEGAKKTADALAKQPADLKEAGRVGKNSTPNTVRSIKELNKLSEEELSEMRGDNL